MVCKSKITALRLFYHARRVKARAGAANVKKTVLYKIYGASQRTDTGNVSYLLISSENRMNMAAICALVASAWGATVPSPMPLITQCLVIQHIAS